MTTTAARPAPALRPPASLGTDALTGTGTLLRLGLRRERIPLIAWILAVSVVAVSTVSAISTLYPGEASRAALASGIAANPAFLVITGPVFDTSVGGVTAWRIGVIGGVLVSLMAIFTMVRRTRAEEETGRTELLASGVVGRATPLASAVILVVGACLAIALLVGLGVWSAGEDAAGAFALGAALAGPGLVFAGVAAVAAQLVESARSATGIAGAALGVAFGLRAAGDVTGLDWLTWLSPIGWVSEVRAFGGNRWWVLLLPLVAAGLLLAAALHLLVRRDIGLAVFPARLGPATNPRLRTPEALAARLQRGPLIGWAVGFAAFGALAGGIADSVGDLLNGNPKMLEMMQRLGGSGVLVDALLAAMGGIAALLAGVYSVSAALRLAGEENTGRAEPVLATAVPRARWMAGHLLFALGGPALLLVIAGVVTGTLHGLRSGDFPAGFGAGMAAMTAPIPAALVMGGIAVLLFGVLPRLTSLAWGVLAAALLLGQLGPILQLPQWVMDLSPYTHIGSVPAQSPAWAALLILLAVAAVFVAVGIAGFRRRDVLSV